MLVEDVSGNWFMSWDELKLDKEALTGLCWGLSAAVEGGGAEPKGGGTTLKFKKRVKLFCIFFVKMFLPKLEEEFILNVRSQVAEL